MGEFKRFANNRLVSFEDLKNSRNYDPAIINAVEKGNLEMLSQLDGTDRNSKEYMEPILYAYYNLRHSYDVFKYYGQNLQDDRDLGYEIAKDQPELIASTPLAKDWDFIIKSSINNPEVIRYMDGRLKNDPEFIITLCENSDYGNYGVIGAVYQYCKVPDAVSERVRADQQKVMDAFALGTGVAFLAALSEENRNDYNFMRDLTSKYEEAIDYVVNNMEKFGIEGINATRDSSRSFTVDDCRNLITEMAKQNDDPRYAMVLNKLEERGLDNPHIVRWVTAMTVQRDDIRPDTSKKVFNYSVLSAESLNRQISADGKFQLSVENMQSLISPNILKQYVEKLQTQGIEVDKEMLGRIDNYENFYNQYQQQYNEHRDEILTEYYERQGRTDMVEKMKAKRAITLNGVRKQAQGATLGAVTQTTADTREGATEEQQRVTPQEEISL